MNILHHKSWHVRNKDNIERVRRDEENARKEEEERQRKVALAESEARTEVLRNKAAKQIKNKVNDDTPDKIVASTSQHINLFKDIEDGKKEAKGNAEYEKEKKEEKEKQEKAIGLLTYLGQSAIESQVEQPWYLKKRKYDEVEEDSQRPRDESNKKAKYRDDPMRLMTKYVDTKRKVEGKELNVQPKYKLGKVKNLPQNSETEKSVTTKKKHHKKHKKHKKKDKKKKKKKHKETDSDSSSSEETTVTKMPGKTIQQLRAERLRREQNERQKTNVLLKKLGGNEEDKNKDNKTDPEVIYDDRKRSYNSQFNPELVRKRKNHRSDYSDFR